MTAHRQKEIEVAPSEDASLSQIFEGPSRSNLLEFFIILAKHKRFMVLFVGGAIIAAVVISLLLPFYYTSETKIMPPQQPQSIGSAMMGELGQLGGLLGAVGGRDLIKNPSDLYVAMLRSDSIEDQLIKRFSLMRVYKAKKLSDARRMLEDSTLIVAGKEGVISISVDDRDPARAAALANAYVEELGNLTKTLAVTDASKRRLFFEKEAKNANDDLGTAEQALEQTEEKTGVFQPDSQTRVMLQAYAELRARATEKEVEIEAMRSFATSENPDLKRAEQELAAIRSQIEGYERGHGGAPIGDAALEKVPARALEYIRKFREVKYRETLLQLLLRQYEVARIDEAKDSSLIQVLDPAQPPDRRSRPKRAIIVVIATFVAILVAAIWVYVNEAWTGAKEDPHYLARWQLLKFYLSRASGRQART